jgi:hypothetical protein
VNLVADLFSTAPILFTAAHRHLYLG